MEGQRFEADPVAEAGLSDAEADRRRVESGPNEIPERRPPSVLTRVGVQLRDPMILLLIAAAGLTIVLRDVRDLAVIGSVIVLNSLVGVAQELRAERALAALRAMTAPSATVWRGGVLVERAASSLVPGDLIELSAGDIVPADADVRSPAELDVDESALTGESVPVTKTGGDGVSAGTVVTRGHGRAVVTAIGAASAVGRISAMLGQQRPRPTPLQARLRVVGRVLAISAVALSGLVLVSGVLRGRPFGEVVLTAVSLAVAAVPESLPAVVTLALALGARRMAARSAIVRSLGAVETLGSVTVLVSDKTGTLTQGRMMAERVVLLGRRYAVTGRDYSPHGRIAPTTGEDITGGGDDAAAWQRLGRDLALCNDAELGAPDADHPDWWPRGDATEVALLALCAKVGTDAESVRRAYPRRAEIPFTSVRKRMTTVHAAGGEFLVVCKGAPEVLLGAPGRTSGATDVVADSEESAETRAASADLARSGFRVLAVADGRVSSPDPATAEHGLHLVGLVGLTDPPKADARAVVESTREAGVEIVMVTGDHPETAQAIAARLGIGADRVLTGADLDRVGAALPTLAGPRTHAGDPPIATLFARTRPEQKLDIVAALQDRGHVVAMTGDGVNDAPALRRADIGVAMGRGGTEVAKQAADLVLTDDNLSTTLVAIAEGRRIYTNIRTFLRYALAGGLAEVLVMALGPAVGLPVPLVPAQILWINLLTHGLPGVAFGAEPGDPAAMHRPPRPPAESVLGAGLARQIVLSATVLTVISLAAGRWRGTTDAAAQTAVFLALGLGQLGIALALRRPRSTRRPGFLDVAVLSAAALQLAAVYVGPLARLLETSRVPWPDAAGLVALAVVPGALVALGRRTARGRTVRTGTGGARAGC